jgi:hypothetical protein
MSEEAIQIVCDIDLPARVRERLLRVGMEELARTWRKEDPEKHRAYYSLCPICLSPTWKSSTFEGTGKAICASVDHSELCLPCGEARHRFPDVFQWVVYVLGMRGLIGGESR